MKCPYCIKVCNCCSELLVAYSGNFSKQKGGKYGLNSKCKRCSKEYNKKYYEVNRDYIKECVKKYRKENKDKYRERSKKYYEENKDNYKEYYEENKEHIKEYDKKRYEENKDKYRERSKKRYEENRDYYKEYYEENKEHIKEYDKKRYEENKDKIKEKSKKYYEENKKDNEEYKKYKKEYDKKYSEENPNKIFNRNNNRRIRLEQQGNGITKEQWYEMMCFFDWKCAYSGIQLNKDNRSIDHIVPLSLNGEHEIWNCIPMYMPYNSSKNTKNMEKWYKEQEFYSEERLQKIYEWCEYAYNKWYKDEDEKENEKEQKDKMSEL